MRIYIATCLELILRARKLAVDLRELGHEVVSTWHDEPIEQANRAREKSLGIDDQQIIQMKNLDAVRRCDSFVCIPDPRCRGTLVEYGVALACYKTLVAIQADHKASPSCMMSLWSKTFLDEHELMETLKGRT